MKKTILIPTDCWSENILKDIVQKRNDTSLTFKRVFGFEHLEDLEKDAKYIILLANSIYFDILSELTWMDVKFHVVMALPFFFEGIDGAREAVEKGEHALTGTLSSFSAFDKEELRERSRNETVRAVQEYTDKQITALVEEAIDAENEDAFAQTRKGNEVLQRYKERLLKEKKPQVLYSIGRAYEYGEKGEQDFRKAFEHYLAAAELGLAAAQYALGIFYACGRGVETNLQKAFEWYEQAANKSYKEAYCALAQMYELGWGTDLNFQEAHYWYEKAADREIAQGMFKIACMYRDGIGIERNLYCYEKWMYEAAIKGHEGAREEFRKLAKQEEREKKRRIITEPLREEAHWTERLSTFIKRSGDSTIQFAKRSDIDPLWLIRVLKKKEEPTITMLQAIQKAYPLLDLNWLIGKNN